MTVLVVYFSMINILVSKHNETFLIYLIVKIIIIVFLFIFEKKKNYLNPYVIYKVKVEVIDLLIDHTINYLIHKVKQLKHRYNICHSNNKAIKKITLRFGNEVKNKKRASPMAKPFHFRDLVP